MNILSWEALLAALTDIKDEIAISGSLNAKHLKQAMMFLVRDGRFKMSKAFLMITFSVFNVCSAVAAHSRGEGTCSMRAP